MKNWRKIGVGLLAYMMLSGGVMAAHDSTSGQIGTGRSHGYLTPPSSGGSNSFGGCNKDNTFCWSVTLPPTPPSGPYYTYPIEVYGDEAKVIVERGHVIDRRFSWDSWRLLVKTGWQSWFQYKNKVFDCAVSHREPKQFYCEQWTSQVPW